MKDDVIEEFASPAPSDTDTVSRIADHIRAILTLLGEDPDREGLIRTPERAARALWFITEGYRKDEKDVLNGAVFCSPGSGMVTVRDIEFYSMCEHHILPFFGSISIGYMPGDKILGLSKLARIVNVYARRLQVQEHLTAQIADAVMRLLPGCRGVIVQCRARHLCMMMRGVQKAESSTVTVESRGVFEDDATLRAEFFQVIS